MANDQNQNDRGGYLLLIIPLLITSVLLFIGWLVAKAGASYRVTKIVLYPAIFFTGNFFAVIPFICCGWLLALVTGNTAMANYVVGNASELSLLTSIFGDPISIPVWHIIVYQLCVWYVFMRSISDVITTTIYNLAQD